jgi:hypothetical protein
MEPPCGPRRQRPFAPLGPPEPDPHAAAHEFPRCRRVPMTGSHLTLQPQYRRKPPYRTMTDGSAVIHIADAAEDDALNWARHFAEDARLCEKPHSPMHAYVLEDEQEAGVLGAGVSVQFSPRIRHSGFSAQGAEVGMHAVVLSYGGVYGSFR